MGSFYSTCSISNMTLTNQKTSIQLLVSGRSTEIGEGASMIVSNEGAQMFYSPFAFPIHGKYYDYGYLEDIVEDKNTKMLEEYFNMSIDNIIRCIGREGDVPKDAKNIKFYNSLSMTYFRTEILEYLQEGWNQINLKDTGNYSSRNQLVRLLDKIEKKGFDNSKRIKELEKIIKSGDKSIFKEYMDLIKENDFTSDDYFYISTQYTKNMFRLLPIDSSFKNEILKQYQFMKNFGYGLNRILLPSNYGTQEDNWAPTYKLNEFVNDLLYEDMKKGEYYGNEDTEINSIIKSHKRNKNLKELGI